MRFWNPPEKYILILWLAQFYDIFIKVGTPDIRKANKVCTANSYFNESTGQGGHPYILVSWAATKILQIFDQSPD